MGLKCENHAAAIILLKELFEINNESISFAKKERIDKQYYTDFDITKDQVEELINSAEEFIAEVNFSISKLNSETITKLRNEFTKIYLI